MADKQNLEGEVLNESELNEVAGGTLNETLDDRALLKKIGAYDFDSSAGFTKTVQDAFAKWGNDYGMKITVDVDLNKNNTNKYFVNGKEMSRDKLWKMIDTLSSK